MGKMSEHMSTISDVSVEEPKILDADFSDSEVRVMLATEDREAYTKHGADGPVREGQWLVLYKHEVVANYPWMDRTKAVEFAKGFRDMQEVLAHIDQA
jgi:hypothetical protein